MTINIYLIRLLVAFVFGAITLINILGIYYGISEGWRSRDMLLTIAMHILAIAIFLGSGYLLWVIKWQLPFSISGSQN